MMSAASWPSRFQAQRDATVLYATTNTSHTSTARQHSQHMMARPHSGILYMESVAGFAWPLDRGTCHLSPAIVNYQLARRYS